LSAFDSFLFLNFGIGGYRATEECSFTLGGPWRHLVEVIILVLFEKSINIFSLLGCFLRNEQVNIAIFNH